MPILPRLRDQISATTEDTEPVDAVTLAAMIHRESPGRTVYVRHPVRPLSPDCTSGIGALFWALFGVVLETGDRPGRRLGVPAAAPDAVEFFPSGG